MKEMMSNSWIPTITSIILAIFAVLMMFRRRKSSSAMEWPVGPKTLPIVGNLHVLGGDSALHDMLHKLAQVYGSVMTIWIGSWKPVIVVSEFDQAWEVLVNKSLDYSAREMPEITKIVTANWRTIKNSHSGPFWATLKKGLQTVALSPQNIASQTALQEEDMRKLIEYLKVEAALNSGIVNPLDHLKKATVRLISRLIYGKDFDDAVVKETMRMKPIASLEIPHKPCKDTSLMGKKFDMRTNIMVNIHALHHTEKVWSEPYRFMPERLLQKHDKAMEESLLPLSAGMRIYAGMELGKLQFSFSLANIVNTFKWSCVSDGVLPDINDRLSGYVRFSKTPLEARIVPRM
ncbi:hypothetical protein C5167_020167 [Papaver somniferum]|uniref:(S)-canadine synthase n=1 Tax=Papaver somniferum TaxID=3469 RepID=A0A4Y7IUD0_PAPSO|nr:hypothetical protein C5167_020167 [Papaver somniferum]